MRNGPDGPFSDLVGNSLDTPNGAFPNYVAERSANDLEHMFAVWLAWVRRSERLGVAND